jgi:hypothetical protein
MLVVMRRDCGAVLGCSSAEAVYGRDETAVFLIAPNPTDPYDNAGMYDALQAAASGANQYPYGIEYLVEHPDRNKV